MKISLTAFRSIVAAASTFGLLVGCGGDTAASASEDDSVAIATEDDSTSSLETALRKRARVGSRSPVAGAPATGPITLTNLPDATTKQTSASIGYSADPAYQVYCRLDSYAPIPCPNPFELGKARPLVAGNHRVDYYRYAGTALDTSRPDASYAWTITAAPTSPAEPVADPVSVSATPVAPAVVGTVSSTPLSVAPTPVPTAVSGSSAQWDGRTAIVVNGVQMMAPVADPSGSGRTVNLHRITQGGASISGGVRSEQLWIGKAAQALTPGKDIWMSFAVQRKADETFGSSTGDDAHLVFQTHTPQPGDTQPDIALVASGQSGTMGWHVAYNTSGTVDGQGWMSTEGKSWVHKEALPAPGVWYRYVVHYRPGYVSSHSPLLEVWRAKPGGAYEKIVNHTGFNTYNTSATGAGASYPRIGLYKYSGSVWTTSSVAWYLTPLYFGTGADLLEAGKASLAGL